MTTSTEDAAAQAEEAARAAENGANNVARTIAATEQIKSTAIPPLKRSHGSGNGLRRLARSWR
jgi:methyl-accepting chemotaxis protein